MRVKSIRNHIINVENFSFNVKYLKQAVLFRTDLGVNLNFIAYNGNVKCYMRFIL